jgi:DNA-binding NarL/FixJ family response regulator
MERNGWGMVGIGAKHAQCTHTAGGGARIQVAVYSADEEFIHNLKTTIERDGNLSWGGFFKSRRDFALDNAQVQQPSVYVVDIRQSARLLSQLWNAALQNTLCIINDQDPVSVPAALEFGVRRFSTASIPHVIAAIRPIHDDAVIMPLCAATQLAMIHRKKTKLPSGANRVSVLTAREQQIFECISHGQHAKTIAYNLQISIETLRTHRKNILAKLNSRTMIQAIAQSPQV